jgi:UDP:flavonoid glycosyltransferase YjiC (YdhE family)
LFLGGIVLRRIVDKPVNQVRRKFHVQPGANLMWTGNLSPTFTALAVSPAFMPRQDDWPEYIRVTGFCFWDGSVDWQFPAKLKAFLNGRKPVVTVTSGTVAPGERTLFAPYYRTSAESILACGARALLLNEPEMPGSIEDNDDVLNISFAPFSQIFPSCAAVIHHGGIGTIGQCLRAGVPSLVVPGGMDQPFNAAQVALRKAGIWISRKHYTARRARQALNALLYTPTYQEQARKVQARIMQEDGVATLRVAIEQILRDKRQE